MKVRSLLVSIGIGLVVTMSGCSLSSANQNYQKAVSAYKSGDYAKAEQYFKKAVEHNSDKAEYHIDYGFALIQLNQFDQAREQFQYVIMEKDIPMVKENNKKAYRGMGISYLTEGNYVAAAEQFGLALEQGQDITMDNDLRYYKASALLQSGDTKEAAELYTQILETNPKDANIYNARAGLYRVMKEYDLSIADYDRAIELTPKDFNLYVGKFATLQEYGKQAEAQAVLEQAANLDVSSDSDKLELAKVHFYQGQYESASNGLEIASKNYPEAYYFLGEIALTQQDYKAAIQNFNQYIEAGEGVSAMLYNQLLTCYLEEEDYEKAKECLEKAKKLINLNVHDQLLKNEIIYLEHTGQYEEALECMKEYQKLYPEDEQAQKDYYFLTTRVEASKAPEVQEPAVVKP